MKQPDLLAGVEAAVRARGGDPSKGESTFTCPESAHHANGDEHKSSRWNSKKKAWWCPVCNLGGSYVDLAKRLGLAADSSRPERRIIATYDYRDEQGALLFQVVRSEPKGFSQRRPHGNGGYVYNLDGVRRVLYRVPELLGADLAAPVYVVEGEKDADALAALGLVSTCNPGGAEKWRSDYNAHLRARHVVILADNDEPGHRHAEEVRLNLEPVAASVCVLELPGLPPKGDVSDWLRAGGTAQRLKELVRERLREAARAAADGQEVKAPAGPWAKARSAPEFVNTAEPEVAFLEPKVLAPGSVTMLASPRGLGKTHVAYAWAMRLARAGRRVLLLDRDNSRREIRRRLRAWGAGGADTATLKVMTRDEVPPLTDGAAWRAFPFGDYDLVIVDSLDASTEGVGEKDSAKPSKALAPMLDIAHRADGPAILVLGNTVKSAEHARGSGVNEDRSDVVYELRDATGVAPSGTKPWWQELPEAGASAWAARAERRKRRDAYRLAFIPSKFRIGEEPEPFVLELNLAGEPWTLRDVTAEMLAAGREASEREQEAREARRHAAAEALADEVRRRPPDKPINRTEATELLKSKGVRRDDARALLDAEAGRRWRIEYVGGQGGGYALRPVTENGAAQINTPPGNPRQSGLFGEGISAARVPPDGTNQAVPKAAPAADSGAPPLVRASIDADRGNGQGENPHGAMASAQASAEREALAARGVLLSRAGRAGYPSVELRYGDSVPAGREAWELFATGGTAEDVAAAGAWLDHVSGEPAGEDDVA